MTAGQTAPEMLQMTRNPDPGLPKKLLLVGLWRLHLLTAVAIFCNYSRAALEATAVATQCNDVLLRIALAVTKCTALCLSTMLRLNAFLGQTLAGVLFSREAVDQRRHSICSTCESSETFGNQRSCLLCRGGGKTVLWLKSALHAGYALCGCLQCVSKAIVALLRWCSTFRPSVSTIMTLCGLIRSLLSTCQTVTGYATQVLDIFGDQSLLISRP